MSLVGNAIGNTIRGKINTIKSIRGYSAYEVAVINGFKGTEEEWLASLKGEQGEKGDDYVLTDDDKTAIAGMVTHRVNIWDNPNPGAAYEGQNVTWDSADYIGVEIIFRISASCDLLISSGFIPKGTAKQFPIVAPDIKKSNWAGRRCLVDQVIGFMAGYTFSANAPATIAVSNAAMIPYRIYGIK